MDAIHTPRSRSELSVAQHVSAFQFVFPRWMVPGCRAWAVGHMFETRVPQIGHEDKYITTLLMWNLSLTNYTSSGSPNQSVLTFRKQSLQSRLLLDLIRKSNLSQPHHHIRYSRLCHVSTTPYLIQDFCWFTTLKGALLFQLIQSSRAT